MVYTGIVVQCLVKKKRDIRELLLPLMISTGSERILFHRGALFPVPPLVVVFLPVVSLISPLFYYHDRIQYYVK